MTLAKTHASSLITGLRSVSIQVPDMALAETFFTHTWGLKVSDRTSESLYLRASGSDHHVLALHRGSEPASLKCVTLRAASELALTELAQRTVKAGGKVLQEISPITEPSGGVGVTLADPMGRIYQVVYGDAQLAPVNEAEAPYRLAHVVLNSVDVPASQKFLEDVMDFSMSDRTRVMAFMRCNSDHHSIAMAESDNNALNHIAFLVPDLEAVMRGGGRMKDAGYPIEWGPGRHGPGHNAFNYFVGPFNLVIEYTSEVEQIDDNYQPGQPSDWKWPDGRMDHWGISTPPSRRMKDAQTEVFFAS